MRPYHWSTGSNLLISSRTFQWKCTILEVPESAMKNWQLTSERKSQQFTEWFTTKILFLICPLKESTSTLQLKYFSTRKWPTIKYVQNRGRTKHALTNFSPTMILTIMIYILCTSAKPSVADPSWYCIAEIGEKIISLRTAKLKYEELY